MQGIIKTAEMSQIDPLLSHSAGFLEASQKKILDSLTWPEFLEPIQKRPLIGSLQKRYWRGKRP